MSNENSAANRTCRVFVLVVFLIVICVFAIAIGMPGSPNLRIRRHFAHAAQAAN